MCGIAGIIYAAPDRQIEDQLLKKMCDVIHHRGPDEWGMWQYGPIGIGMKRLRIIDLAGGKQPIENATGTTRIVFNGEIYNYKNLRKELIERGYIFKTKSDTETILHLYEEFGTECVNYLRGMFVFAIWDDKNKRLFIARDRFGKKPLHYYHDSRKFVFGSEIKSILQHPDIAREVNRPAIVNYFAYGYVPDPETMFKGIEKLPPGCHLTWQKGKIDVIQYWNINIDPEKSSKSDTFYIDNIDKLIREAVKIRLISDVPLGAFLSGGIDSSLVVAMMANQMNEPVKTFSIGFNDEKYNELPFARMVAKKYKTDHHEEVVEPNAEEILNELLNVFDEPFADSSAIPTYYVSRLARRHVTVALSGDGGDEIFAGYDRYLDSAITDYTDRIPNAVRSIVFGRLSNMLPEGLKGVKTLRYLSAEKDSRYLQKMTNEVSHRFSRVYSPDLISESGGGDPSRVLRQILLEIQHLDDISKRQYIDIKSYLCGDILTKVDRASMLVSLETRAPLLDHKLAEFAATLPVHLKIRKRVKKYVLKRLAHKYLPQELINRPKMGFAIPIDKWINDEWRKMSDELVIGTRALKRDNFNPEYLNWIMGEHRSGRRNHSNTIWSLMVLEMWYRSFID